MKQILRNLLTGGVCFFEKVNKTKKTIFLEASFLFIFFRTVKAARQF